MRFCGTPKPEEVRPLNVLREAGVTLDLLAGISIAPLTNEGIVEGPCKVEDPARLEPHRRDVSWKHLSTGHVL